ncbi:MAG TPA: ChbG/HpnK family deacetylase [Thermomicrobiales bacterium]|jgi:predicted glycoside hydrolase/deacetylase ChbG (UPF0249 family)
MSTPGRLLVVNADDFGLTAGVNAGIIGAFQRGIVRSASLMVTTPGFEDAVALAGEHPTLDLGLHLALTNVHPALAPERIPSLVGGDGRFPSLKVWQRRVALRQLRPEEVRVELLAQVARARRTGLRFTHIDGHHHVHLFGPVPAIIGEIARTHKIPIVRRVKDAPCETKNDQPPGPPAPRSASEAIKRGWLEGADQLWERGLRGLQRTDAFRGTAFPASLGDWRALARSLPVGVTEMMCHPGLRDATVRALDPYVDERERELRWLCDPRVAALLDADGVTLTSFGQLLGLAGTEATISSGNYPQPTISAR